MFDENYTASREKFVLKNKVKIYSAAAVTGDLEKKGPLGDYIDVHCKDDLKEQKTWEQAESEMARMAFSTALSKGKLTQKNINMLFAGDLLNQCVGSGYGLSEFDIPYIGLYGACSTMAEGIMLASLLIDSGHIESAGVVVSSHFCSAERQFRFPLEYGSFSEQTAQTTVTGSGAFILAKADESESGVFVTEVLPGIVCDRGIKDAANMGAAMAPSAADTILRYLKDKKESDFPEILATGDLGKEGLSIVKEMLYKNGIDLKESLHDCGLMIYDVENQDVACGGSGCGCSAVVTAAYFYKELQKKKLSNAVIVGTGAMMSPQSLLQGLSIPAVAHLIKLESR